MKSLLLAFLTLLTALSTWGMSTIELTQGGFVQGTLLDDKPDRIVVDLGFTVLMIPRDAIANIVEEGAEAESEPFGGQLFRYQKNSPVLQVKELVERVGEAVVTVRTPVGLGSGFIIHPSGYVITNDHVVSGEHTVSITVFERNPTSGVLERTQFENVRIIATSPDWDLALLKIEGAGDRRFKTAPIGGSDELRQGQPVFAIGNPLGLERSVSEGIVSLKNRLIGGRLFIQTTAQINPGNSGGPLFNLRGEVVGVNNMKVASMGAEGLGFAIPTSVLERFLLNRDAFAFDPRNPNSGFRYNSPPSIVTAKEKEDQE